MTKNNNEHNQTDIFTMFELVDEVAEEKKRVEAERQKELDAKMKEKIASAATTKGKQKKTEEQAFTPNENTKIMYYGNEIPITKYFTPEELVEGFLVTSKNKEPELRRKTLS